MSVFSGAVHENRLFFVLKLIPGLSLDVFKCLKLGYDAVIIESFGAGNLPLYEDDGFASAIEDLVKCGKTVVITTQVPHEGSDMSVYETGCTIKNKCGVIEAYDMTLEAVVAKLMWILGQTDDDKKIKELFYRPVQKDLII